MRTTVEVDPVRVAGDAQGLVDRCREVLGHVSLAGRVGSQVVGGPDHLATLQAGAAYVKEWNGAKTDAERQMIWNRYGTLMERLSSMFSGRMIFGTAGAIVESQQILRRMDLA